MFWKSKTKTLQTNTDPTRLARACAYNGDIWLALEELTPSVSAGAGVAIDYSITDTFPELSRLDLIHVAKLLTYKHKYECHVQNAEVTRLGAVITRLCEDGQRISDKRDEKRASKDAQIASLQQQLNTQVANNIILRNQLEKYQQGE